MVQTASSNHKHSHLDQGTSHTLTRSCYSTGLIHVDSTSTRRTGDLNIEGLRRQQPAIKTKQPMVGTMALFNEYIDAVYIENENDSG